MLPSSSCTSRTGGCPSCGDLGDQGMRTVLDVLHTKHLPPQPTFPEAVSMGCAVPPLLPPVVLDQITASAICCAALHTKGAAGPSALDLYSWRTLCTSFKSASTDLCHSLALLARKLCTSFVNPKCLSPLLACQFVTLDKCPGVCPIGICETHRRIIAKAVFHKRWPPQGC